LRRPITARRNDRGVRYRSKDQQAADDRERPNDHDFLPASALAASSFMASSITSVMLLSRRAAICSIRALVSVVAPELICSFGGPFMRWRCFGVMPARRSALTRAWVFSRAANLSLKAPRKSMPSSVLAMCSSLLPRLRLRGFGCCLLHFLPEGVNLG